MDFFSACVIALGIGYCGGAIGSGIEAGLRKIAGAIKHIIDCDFDDEGGHP